MICNFCKVRFAYEPLPGELQSEEDCKKEFDSEDIGICKDCDKKFQG